MVWYVVVLLSLCTGLLRRSWWTILGWPAISMGLGVYASVDESPNYDMPGLGYYVGGFVAVVCIIGWLLGRGAATLAHRGNRKAP